MLYYIISYPAFIFSCFTLPWLGLGLHKLRTGIIPLVVLITASILLVPALTGYTYTVNNIYGALTYVIFICGYSILLNHIELKKVVTVAISALLFLIGGFFAFTGAMAGAYTVENQWIYKNYKIEYCRDQGFSGRPKMTYELNKYGIIPIFIKKVDSKWDNDTTGSCWVKFTSEGFNFNKCQTDKSYFTKR